MTGEIRLDRLLVDNQVPVYRCVGWKSWMSQVIVRGLFQKFDLFDEQQLLGRLAIDNGAIPFCL